MGKYYMSRTELQCESLSKIDTNLKVFIIQKNTKEIVR